MRATGKAKFDDDKNINLMKKHDDISFNQIEYDDGNGRTANVVFTYFFFYVFIQSIADNKVYNVICGNRSRICI